MKSCPKPIVKIPSNSCGGTLSVLVCMNCGDYRYGAFTSFKRKHIGPFKEVDENTLYAYLKADRVIDGRFDVAKYREDNP